MKYQLIYPDPAWHFKVRSVKGEGRSAKKHYKSVMSLAEIKALPVPDLSEKDSVLLLWVTDPFLEKGLEVIRYWGFTYKTVGFYWVKQCKKSDGWHIGNGYYTRANPEQCLLATRGKGLKRVSRSVPRLIVSRLREHSRKPDEAYERIEQLFGEVSRLEMFARNNRPGWDAWGNEVPVSISLNNLASATLQEV
jgi:N6-adenosine-specific RNA methylase IME4